MGENDVIYVDLLKGDSGLGFNIRGGVDAQYIPGDNGIFITKIREKGAAASNGQLEEGDKILEINGKNVLSITHARAVALFQACGEKVSLKVQQRAESNILAKAVARSIQNMDVDPFSENDPGAKDTPIIKYVLIGAAVGIIGLGMIFAIKKFRR
ncbi:synaptojanin-2-binding protein-like [Lineus longissimus]|uniref:synaptojanin-2-binding protein-like n=1 Tax=Lineus longissimus TaxID=88925 RepID=UPI00315DAC7E